MSKSEGVACPLRAVKRHLSPLPQVEGSLRLKEIAEGGTTSHKLCLSVVTLWSREADRRPCPASLSFSLTLPTTFSDGKETYVSP